MTPKELAKKLLSEEQFLHSKKVFECYKALVGEDDTSSLVEDAAWLHDVGRSIQSEGHAKLSLKLAEKEFENLDPIIVDCILNHGSKALPNTKEGKIFQLCDKLSVFTPEYLKIIFEKKENPKEFLEKMLEKINKLSSNFKN